MPTLTVNSTKDSSAVKDAAQDPFNGWNGNDAHHPVGRWNSSFVSGSHTYDWKGRGFSYFPISFTGINTIDSATLYFMQRNGGHCDPANGGALSCYVYRMVRDWGESPNNGESLWSQGANYSWTKNAEQFYSGDANWVTEGSATASFTQSNDAWVSVDVTAIVTAWWNHSKGSRTDAPNYGIIFVNTDEATRNKGFDIYTRDESAARTPYITVVYNSNTAPNVVPESGRTPKGTKTAITNVTNNGSGLCRITSANHGFSTGDTVLVTSVGGVPNVNSVWVATVINSSTLDLNGSTFSGTYTAATGYIGTATVVNTLTPSFTGTIDDPDVNDYITNVGLMVRRVLDQQVMWSSPAIPVSGHPTSFNIPYGQLYYDPLLPLVGNTYYKWTTNVMDSGGLWSPWSSYDFFKANTPPNAPTLVIDSPSYKLTPQITVTHNDPDPGDTLQFGYQIILQKSDGTPIWDSGAVDLGVGERATTKTFEAPTLTDPDGNAWATSYRAKARTKDSNNAWGAYSAWKYFYTYGSLPPISLNPSGDEETPTTTPTFTGSRADDTDTITSYQIILYDDNLTQLWDSGTLTTGISNGAAFSKAYVSSLSSGTFYQWKARITSDIGGTSNYSALMRFKTPSDVTVPTPTAPLGNGIQGGGTNPLRPAFTGSRATTYNRYQVEVYPGTATSGNLGTAFYQSGTQSTTISGSGPYVFTLAADTVTALSWNTTYKWRARVSPDAGANWSAWSGLATFTMDSAGTPTLTTPTADQWITDSTPDLTITRAGSDTIDQMQVRVYDANNTTLLWDSTMTNVTNATTGTITYAGPTLSGGYYYWEARYQKTTNGPIGNYAARKRFYLNNAPSAPTELLPAQGAVIEGSLLPLFSARFNDNDIAPVGDYPTSWEIVIESWNGSSFVAFSTKTITTNLVVGANYYQWLSGDTAMSYGTTYQWKTRFKDAQAVWGAYSNYQTFVPAIQPDGTISTPSEGSTVSVVRPTITWSYSAMGGSAQHAVNIKIYEIVDPTDIAVPPDRLTGTANESLQLVANVNKITSDTSYTLEGNYLQNNKVYDIVLTVQNDDLLVDPTPDDNRVWVLFDAPDPILGLSPTSIDERSLIQLNWTAATLKTGHTFVAYNVYKRLLGDDTWQHVGSTTSRTTGNKYDDWYAGHGVLYEYRVTIVTTKTGVGIELESGDDPNGGNIAEAQLSSDVWMFVGADRNDVHIQELPVDDEDHQRIVQQESFETLGADRKVIIRGFVLGHEGQISLTYINQDVPSTEDPQNLINETIKGRRLLDYLTNNKGPHILKSPFGDVWDAEFEGPQYKWLTGGNLQVNLNWTETGETSMVSI